MLGQGHDDEHRKGVRVVAARSKVRPGSRRGPLRLASVLLLGFVCVGALWTTASHRAWSQEAPATTIDVVLEVPASLAPTILTSSDGSETHRVKRLGSGVFELINFDGSVGFVLSPREDLLTPTLTVCNSGGTGDDPAGPWPRLEVTWQIDSAEESSESETLYPGECSSCANCNMSTSWTSDEDQRTE